MKILAILACFLGLSHLCAFGQLVPPAGVVELKLDLLNQQVKDGVNVPFGVPLQFSSESDKIQTPLQTAGLKVQVYLVKGRCSDNLLPNLSSYFVSKLSDSQWSLVNSSLISGTPKMLWNNSFPLAPNQDYCLLFAKTDPATPPTTATTATTSTTSTITNSTTPIVVTPSSTTITTTIATPTTATTISTFSANVVTTPTTITATTTSSIAATVAVSNAAFTALATPADNIIRRINLRPRASLADHIKSDFGIGYAPAIKAVIGQLTVHFYLTAINNDTDLGYGELPLGRQLLSRISFFAGISPVLFSSDTQQDIKNLTKLGNFVYGIGVRSPFYYPKPKKFGRLFLQPMRINGGIMRFYQADANPLISNDRAKSAWFFSLTYDLSIAQILGQLANYSNEKSILFYLRYLWYNIIKLFFYLRRSCYR